jgi:glycosyltransferase involved in cell wall biosynthesis
MKDRMGIPKVLVDLSLAHVKSGFSGIPQDSRLLFDGLANSKTIETEGLLWSQAGSWRGRPPTSLQEQAVFFGSFLTTGQSNYLIRALKRMSPLLSQGFERIILNPGRDYQLYRLRDDTFQDAVWRMFLSSTIDAGRRQALLKRSYFLTTLGVHRVADGALRRLAPVRLDTHGHDFVLFQDARSISVSTGTTKIIRYHDGIPVFSSDTAASSEATRVHIRGVKDCERDSIFVCNSPSTHHDLTRISSRAAEHSIVIPYFVPRMKPTTGGNINLAELALPRVSASTIGKSQPSDVVAKWFQPTPAGGPPDYIVTVATIEPRKNLRGLIAAWQKLRNATGKKIKLLVIGSPGWQFDQILKEMEPFVSTGQLLHLEKVSQDELRYWYSAARCFAFISFAEGFGIPPIEAMQCDCPVLVSDITAHRYSAGDAATYCDPYSSEEIAAKLDFLTRDENRGEIDAMIARGRANADRFTVERVLPLWEELFSRPPNLSRA